ncbi:unnamed protein product [Miscanthus lutarioriparius]|uniref:Uncharacterized protein n=1 Tax=Miscanthus lutarioriparius TaxID=422564 RepID=A0A811RL72_9POAL|nr:unnamed protein product [Miscanthus lutarioriparius]
MAAVATTFSDALRTPLADQDADGRHGRRVPVRGLRRTVHVRRRDSRGPAAMWMGRRWRREEADYQRACLLA